MTRLAELEQEVLTPGQVAQLLHVDPGTVRGWVRSGEAPDSFATLPTNRIGIPRWWVEQLISPAPVVVGPGERSRPSLAGIPGRGGTTLRTIGGDAPPPAA